MIVFTLAALPPSSMPAMLSQAFNVSLLVPLPVWCRLHHPAWQSHEENARVEHICPVYAISSKMSPLHLFKSVVIKSTLLSTNAEAFRGLHF